MRIHIISLIATTTVLFSCGKPPRYVRAAIDSVSKIPGAPGESNSESKAASTMLNCSATEGKIYKGFGGVNLVKERKKDIAKEGDRFRVKPYAALSGEYTRVMGSVPASLTANAASFVAAPSRWYVDTQSSAVTLFTSYRIAYESALNLAGSDAKYALAPTEESATANCTTFARQVWSRMPNSEEIAICKKMALVDTLMESDVKARWAYALASILTSASFLSY